MGKNKRRVVLLVTPQTAYNLQRLADMDKTSPGRVVDKLVRDRMIELSERTCPTALPVAMPVSPT